MEGLHEIHARLRAADVALARMRGGSSELAAVREATGALLVALHELVGLYERQLLAATGGPVGAEVGAGLRPAPAGSVPAAQERGGNRSRSRERGGPR